MPWDIDRDIETSRDEPDPSPAELGRIGLRKRIERCKKRAKERPPTYTYRHRLTTVYTDPRPRSEQEPEPR